jgi:hypothetical protein
VGACCSAGAGRAITAGSTTATCAAATGAAASDETSMHSEPNRTLVRTAPVDAGASNVTLCWHAFRASETRGIFFLFFCASFVFLLFCFLLFAFFVFSRAPV